ncbi:hypothetical protein [Streptomyces sp. NPDC101206]|uniref:hypothetical protein n=1 Tax=Streptomyces sp. NPDC101206 TaxID=3366128 RepID=UPI00382E2096
MSLPEDTGTRVYHLRPEGGGEDWSARGDCLLPAAPPLEVRQHSHDPVRQLLPDLPQGPSADLRARADHGLTRFLEGWHAAEAPGEEG